MSRSQFGPAAGTTKGPAPLIAIAHLPEYLTFTRGELHILTNILPEPNAFKLYQLLRTHADFTSGEVLTTYARLIALMTPARPEKGPRRAGPSYEQIRRLLRDFEDAALVRRDASQNAAQGQLRLWLPHVEDAASERQHRRAQAVSAQGSTQGRNARKAA